MKKVFSVIVCFILSLIVVYLPSFLKDDKVFLAFTNEKTILKQKIISYSKEAKKHYKLYSGDNLIGTIKNPDSLNNELSKLYRKQYQESFPNTKLTYGQDVYLLEEYAYYELEDIDKEIIDYFIANELYAIACNVLEFSTKDGIYDVIYISDLKLFEGAKNRFLLNFISNEALQAFNNNEHLPALDDFGSIDTGVRINETISHKKGVAKPSEIFNDENSIYEYLCYGRNKERQYYTVKEGENLQGVGFHFDNMSPQQIMMLNPDIIKSVDQILQAGMTLNVTYYTSPITIIVTKERLAQESVIPETPIYVEDDNVYEGQSSIITDERNGLKNVLYEEVWINGVLKSGNVRSSKIIEEPIRGVISIGTKSKPNVGTGNFGWPCDNPKLTCGWYCYPGHKAIDVVNRYERYAPILAADNGTVIDVSYDSIGGNHITIDHNNGYKTYYGHLNVPAFPSVGQTVMRGEIIGQMGDTGLAFGVHTHFAIYVDNVLVDPCTIVRCDAIR